MTVAALRVSGAVAVVFVLLTLTFAALATGYFDVSSGWHHWRLLSASPLRSPPGTRHGRLSPMPPGPHGAADLTR